MPSTYSTNLRLEKQANGENDTTWGTKMNTVIDLIEAAISGRSSVTHDDAASYTLTTANSSADEARNMILNVGGALTANRNLVVPTASKLYVVKNATTGGYYITVKTAAGTGIVVPNGKTMLLMCDGTNVVNAFDYTGALTDLDISPMCYLLPSMADGWRGIYRAGFDWWSRNQQWGGPFGGEMLDAATDTLYRCEFATGYIESNTVLPVGDTAARTYIAQGLKVPETQTIAALWVKLYKTGNPANNLGLTIYSDTAGAPNAAIANGAATAQSGKLVASDTNGAWYRFVFSTPPSLTGGTQYHFVLTSSGAVDGSNYWNTIIHDAKKYPFGNWNKGDGTPTWTATTTGALNFLVELSATAQTLQASGTFDGKLAFGGSGASGTLSMSRGLRNMVPLRELMDPTESTGYLVGTALTKDATIFDSGYGEDHDRIVVRSNVTTGYGQIDVYESDGTKVTVTATATDLSSGAHSVGWYVRAQNDGSDRVDLFIDGTTYSSATNLSISFDKNFANLGTMYLGGGFAVAPTWTGNAMTDTAQLPSHANNGSWTWTGTGTEADCMSMQGGKLFQNKNGYASTDTGYYVKDPTFSNANGWVIAKKFRNVTDTNTNGKVAVHLNIFDGTKTIVLQLQEYFYREGSVTGWLPQFDWKAKENVLSIVGKGVDCLVFANRKLLDDHSGQLTSASVSNQIHFGDNDATASENADVTYSYVKYYNTAWNPPQFTAGSISEFAIWQGNMKALWPLLYNAGAQVSVKALLGVQRNYVDKSDKIPAIVQRGITSAPTTTSTTGEVVPELELFTVMDKFSVATTLSSANDGAGNTDSLGVYMNGATVNAPVLTAAPVAGYRHTQTIARSGIPASYLGLHKVSTIWIASAGTRTAAFAHRALSVEPKL